MIGNFRKLKFNNRNFNWWCKTFQNENELMTSLAGFVGKCECKQYVYCRSAAEWTPSAERVRVIPPKWRRMRKNTTSTLTPDTWGGKSQCHSWHWPCSSALSPILICGRHMGSLLRTLYSCCWCCLTLQNCANSLSFPSPSFSSQNVASPVVWTTSHIWWVVLAKGRGGGGGGWIY